MRPARLIAGILAVMVCPGCSPEGDEAKAKMAKSTEQVDEKRRELDHQREMVQQEQKELESYRYRERPPRSHYDEGITPDWSATAHACPECEGKGQDRSGKCWNCKGTGFSFEPSPPRLVKVRPTRTMDR